MVAGLEVLWAKYLNTSRVEKEMESVLLCFFKLHNFGKKTVIKGILKKTTTTQNYEPNFICK